MKQEQRQKIIGWDIGGAHIKAAVFEPEGYISSVFQYPCPLWKGIEFLSQAVKQILNEISAINCKHAITMTGELVDLFDNRDHGVEQIILAMQGILKGKELLIYTGSGGFFKPEDIRDQQYISIASANWLASASLAGSKVGNGLFIDIGSTTTDILVLSDRQVKAIGFTDFDRMVSDELVYTGIIRTAVMAVAQTANFKGQQMGLMAEYFATMADVYRLTGELSEVHDQTDTADGADKTIMASAKRLSRMTGFEFSNNDIKVWIDFANNIKGQQKHRIQKACERQLSRQLISKKDCFIGAGVGRFLVKQIADDLGYAYQDFTDLFESKLNNSDMNVADCAPAVAVSMLVAS